MTAHNVYRPKHVSAIQFGGTDFTETDLTSTTVALDTAFATNNPATATAGSANTQAIQLDLVGTQTGLSSTASTASPNYSDAFAREITFSGNERSVNTQDLLGANTDGTQNQEVDIAPNSLLEVEMTIVYRNPVPMSIFNDNTKCCLMVFDNEETSKTGVTNIVFKTITVLTVGGLSLTPEGKMEQKVRFMCKGGTTGTSIICNTGTETWYRVRGGDYAEETRTN